MSSALVACGGPSLDPGFESSLTTTGACEPTSTTSPNLYATDSEGSILVSVFLQHGVSSVLSEPKGEMTIDLAGSTQPVVVYLELGKYLDSLLCDEPANITKGAKTQTRYHPTRGSLLLKAVDKGAAGVELTATLSQVLWAKELHESGVDEQTMPSLVIGPVVFPAI